ncbi:MAG TPA: hypothetical protein VGP80_07295 [Gemmatimonadales bacterium]|nr:hypothetical protein [Gemmatimonadales bacterium]
MAVSALELFTSDSSTDHLDFAPFLTRARAERERGLDVPARIALGAYLVARLVDRRLTITDNPDDIEGFRWQLESTRKFLVELPTEETEVAHTRGIVDSVSSEPEHRDAILRMALVAYAYYLEHEGRFEEALDILRLGGRTYRDAIPPVDAATMALFVARLNRMLARWEPANLSYNLAEQAGVETRDVGTVMLARIGKANVLRGQGNLPTSREILELVVAETGSPELADVHGRALSDLSVVLDRQGNLHDALLTRYRALLSLRDELQRTRVLGDLGIGLRAVGAYDAARQCYNMVLSSDSSFIIRANTCLELMEMESAVGNRIAFERFRQEARTFEARMPPSMAIDYRYKVGIGFARFGKDSRARAVLREALGMAEERRLNEWYFRVDRVLRNLEVCHDEQDLKVTAAEAIDMAPAVAEVSAGLRELVAAGAYA